MKRETKTNKQENSKKNIGREKMDKKEEKGEN